MTKNFYDQLSAFYHLLFPEGFDISIQRHAAILDGVIRKTWGDRPSSIIDASCGIGTQAIGLAKLGYSVSASDLSPKAIERARHEAESRNVAVEFHVSDMRNLKDVHLQTADVVISVDAAVNHLLSDGAILAAFQQFYDLSNVGGGCIVTARDCEPKELKAGTITPYGVKEVEGTRHIIFLVRDCHPDIDDLSMYHVRDHGDDVCEISVLRTQQHPVSIARLMELLEQAGFADMRRIDDIFFQPVVVGKKV